MVVPAGCGWRYAAGMGFDGGVEGFWCGVLCIMLILSPRDNAMPCGVKIFIIFYAVNVRIKYISINSICRKIIGLQLTMYWYKASFISKYQ